ncbi:MAG: hypothetical protein HKM98_10305, partial [Gammaproteobacteria bacterium]|nr:hypothetical protein [Gammaproteobacteria bacterium]
MLKMNFTNRLVSLLAVSILAVACGGGGGTSGGGGGGTVNTDTDNDGVANTSDNCPTVANATQIDTDNDGAGNACDTDDDNDGVSDASDNCPLAANAGQADNENDGVGNDCDADDDNDGIDDSADNCPLVANADQQDTDADGSGDVCDVDDDNDGIADGSDNCPLTSNPAQLDTDGDGFGDACDSNTNITISGKVTFEHVPHNTATNGLNYAAATFDPARNVNIEILAAGTETVLANAETDNFGDYAAQVPINTNIFVRARAEMIRAGAPGWNVRVVDNTQSDALYVLESGSFNTGTADATQDLAAGSGWGGASYTGIRAAAPFAALDAINDAMNEVLSVDPTAQMPDLLVKWSPDNNTATGDESMGEIGNTFFRRNLDGSREILLLGAEDSDTDEYDQHVVIHEWGHYFEDAFSRADTVGGAHSPGDRLDPRVAFSEGWGYAYAGITTGDPVTRDALGFGQASGFEIDVDENDNLNPGWFSEGSAQSIIYDVVDAGTDGVDATNLGFGPIYNLMSGQLAASVPPLTLFSFIELLKQENPAAASGIDAIVNNQSIDSN